MRAVTREVPPPAAADDDDAVVSVFARDYRGPRGAVSALFALLRGRARLHIVPTPKAWDKPEAWGLADLAAFDDVDPTH
jgi:hypothetical protein